MIYFVTVMDEFKDEKNAKFCSPVSKNHMYWIPDNKATIGYFRSLEDAIKAVEENEQDIFECTYNYAVIEAYSEGFYPVSEIQPLWFRENRQTGKADRIDPPVYNHIFQYAF